MTEEERRNTPPSSTEQVERSRQIVVYRGSTALKQLGLVPEEKLAATREMARGLGLEHFYSLIPSEYARVSSQVMEGRDGSKEDVDAYYTDEVVYIVVRGDEKTNSFVVADAIHFDAELSEADVARITEEAKNKIRREGIRGLSDSVGVYRDVFGANGGSVARSENEGGRTQVVGRDGGALEEGAGSSEARANFLRGVVYSRDQKQKLAERVSTNEAERRYSRELKNPDGTVFGWYDPVKREIHLNEDMVDFDTPVHEFTHAWSDIVEQEDKRLADHIVSLVQNTKEYAAFVKEMNEEKFFLLSINFHNFFL